ncbi:MAG: DegT/DnrJ/EryC1/StrS family aminotransferase [Gemmatimonadetes bacterium]|nr:DegT/DnrJ/EryC1/StrS family aminotransferase [Gemmatimonadota bacterium]
MPQYERIRDEVGAAISRVVEAQGFILGPEVEALEAELASFLNVPHAVGCASGTDALLLPLRALTPAPGDEAILPAFTFFATAGAAWNAGFRPVFCDVDPLTFNVTAETIEAVWTERTRAVIPVHLFGQMPPMAPIMELARERGAFVLEDAAQAIGARQQGAPGPARDGWVMAGAAGDAGAFSFFPTKNLGGFGDGGLVATSDPELADRVAKLRVHGGRQMYHHEMVGTNSRLDALQAAVLRTKLRHLPGWTEGRRGNAKRYEEGLAEVEGVSLPVTVEGNEHVYNQYTIRARDRDGLRTRLQERRIGTGVYYPAPLHLQPCFQELGGRPGDLPVSERLCGEVLSLPVFPELGEERLGIVVDAIREFYA